MKNLGYQIICSTLPNQLGDRLTLNDLQKLIVTMPNVFPIYKEHDISKPPIGFSKNPKICNLENDEYCIEAEVIAFNENDISTLLGFSIAYEKKSNSKIDDSNIDIQFDDRFIPTEIILESSKAIITNDINIIKVHRNAFPEIGLIVIYISTAVFSGFLNEIGKSFYDNVSSFINKLIQSLNEHHKSKKFENLPKFTNLILKGEETIKNDKCEFIMKLSNIEGLPINELTKTFNKARKSLLKLIKHENKVPERISIEYNSFDSDWKLVYIQRKDGSLFKSSNEA